MALSWTSENSRGEVVLDSHPSRSVFPLIFFLSLHFAELVQIIPLTCPDGDIAHSCKYQLHSIILFRLA